MKDAIIVDLDGTLCNCSSRSYLAEQKNWDEFFSLLGEDTVNEGVATLVRKPFGLYYVLYVSGRPEKCRGPTVSWLMKSSLPVGKIFLRKDKDYRPDYVVKEEIYDNEIKQEYKVVFAIDDKKEVCDMWRRRGIETFLYLK